MKTKRVLLVEEAVRTSAAIQAAFFKGGLKLKQVVQCSALFAAMQEIRRLKRQSFHVVVCNLVIDGDQWAGVKMVEFLAHQNTLQPYRVVLYSSVNADQSFKTTAYWEELKSRVAVAEESGRVTVHSDVDGLSGGGTLTHLVATLLFKQ